MDFHPCTTKGDAFAPWKVLQTGEGVRGLVHAAVLAANAHNSQPWRFRILSNAIAISADLDRHLGSFDPFRREMHQSLGCAIENLVLAARAEGFEPSVQTMDGVLPPADPEAAWVQLAPGTPQASDLFHAIPRRRTHRGRYETGQGISQSQCNEMLALQDDPDVRLVLFQGASARELGDLIVSAAHDIVADWEMAADNAKWFRFHTDDVDRHRDGLTLDANVSSPILALAGKLLPPSDETATRSWLKDTARVHVGTAALLGAITVRNPYDRGTALGVGRLWQRLHLWLTVQGLAGQPLNQPVERVDRERQLDLPPHTAEALARITGDSEWRPTFVFRAGYPAREACFSPRRPLASVVSVN